MTSHYEINVSKEGWHWFATAEKSLYLEEQMLIVYRELKKRFPEEEGFKITVTHWNTVGTQYTFDDENNF